MNIDFRGLWLLAGAWLAAWFLPPIWVVVPCLLSVALLFALAARTQHDRSYAAPWFTGPLLLLTAAVAVMVGNQGHTTCHLPLTDSATLRVMWEYSDTPRASDDGLFKGRAELLGYRESENWVSCEAQIYVTAHQPPPAGARSYTSLMRLESTGARSAIRYWGTVTGPLTMHTAAVATRSDGVKDAFAAAVESLPDSAQALLPGMLYGDRSLQDDRLTEAMKATGLSHLTAVSGSNCAIVGGIVMLILRALGAMRFLVLSGLAASLVLFTLLVGPEPSVLRAAVMGAIAAVSLHFGRGRASLGILCLSATLLLLISPELAAEAAFALSVLATLGIIVFAPPITVFLSRAMPEFLAQPIAICAAAQLTCLPVIIALSEKFSLYSIPLNLLVTAVIPLITVIGILCVALVLAAPALVDLLVWIPGIPAWGIGELALWAVSWPGAQRPWPPGAFGVLLATGFTLGFGIVILTVMHAEHPWLRRLGSKILVFGMVALCALLLPATSLIRPTPPHWQLAMCDVGQGDAFVISLGDRSGWLIDTGSADSGLLNCLKDLGIEKLEAVFITHAHEDHMGALPELLASPVPVAEIFSSAPVPVVPQRQPRQVQQGDEFSQGSTTVWVLGPDPEGISSASINDTSLVLLLEFRIADRTYSFLSAGDMEEHGMSKLLDELTQQEITVLKASHHGARNGGTQIIEHFTPRLLLISVGAGNSYGHPHESILQAAQEQGTEVLRSDINGTVTITFEHGRATATGIAGPVR